MYCSSGVSSQCRWSTVNSTIAYPATAIENAARSNVLAERQRTALLFEYRYIGEFLVSIPGLDSD
jgi:hypothetical protein